MIHLQNGGYINPPAIKRQHRDPYADWWDPQERRSFGEPVHEDNDLMGIFSPWDYTWTTTGPGLLMIGTFISVFLGVSSVVYFNYPDKVAYPREFEAGLERELGGPGAVRVRTDDTSNDDAQMLTWTTGAQGGRRGPLRHHTARLIQLFPLCTCNLGRIQAIHHICLSTLNSQDSWPLVWQT
jgi:hypothetical protein